jgi:hypothetical protein
MVATVAKIGETVSHTSSIPPTFAPISRTPPALPELSSAPDHRELAKVLGSFVVWLHHQWPGIIDRLARHDRQTWSVEAKVTAMLRQRRSAARVETAVAFVLGVLVASLAALAWSRLAAR